MTISIQENTSSVSAQAWVLIKLKGAKVRGHVEYILEHVRGKVKRVFFKRAHD